MNEKSRNDFELSSKISSDKSERPLNLNNDDDRKDIVDVEKKKKKFF